MGTIQSNTEYNQQILVSNYDGSALTGLTSSNFTITYKKDSSDYSGSITDSIAEESDGLYKYTATFPQTGFWLVSIVIANSTETVETQFLNINVTSPVSGGSTYSSEADAGSTVQNTVGGISSGTTVESLTGRPVSEILDDILFPPPPRQNPNVSQPSVGLTSSVSGLRIAGSSINVNFTTTASLGTISASWINPTQEYAGPLSSAEYEHEGSTVSLQVTGSIGIEDFQASNHTVLVGNNSWTLRGTFSAGSNVPVDNYGDNSGSAFAGGTKSRSRSFEGVYPVFIKNSLGTFDQMSLMSHSTSTINMSQPFAETSSIRHAIKIPNAMGTSPTFQVWNSISSAYATPESSQFSSTQTTEAIEGSVINYTLYEKIGSVGGGDVGSQPLYRITGL